MKTVVVMLLGWCMAATTPWGALSAGEPTADTLPQVELSGDGNLVNDTARETRIRLDLAKRKRVEHDHEQASQILAAILDEPVPASFKREALLELAMNARDAGHSSRALQVYSHYIQLYPQDPSIPEVLLEQGRLYRRLGANTMAVSKFYGVMTTILNMKQEADQFYKRLVIEAQSEIAETYYNDSKHAEAAELYARLLKSDAPQLNRAEIHLKLVRCLSRLPHAAETASQARQHLAAHGDNPEVRYILVVALDQLGQKNEAINEVLHMIEAPVGAEWKRQAGNRLANEMYTRGDYTAALLMYQALAQSDPSPDWQIPALYQVGLTSEKLRLHEQALASYSRVLELGVKLVEPVDPAVKTVLDMATWRKNYLAWLQTAQQVNQAVQTRPPPMP
jgi:tetratricopeptide (TPR) repeat protein